MRPVAFTQNSSVWRHFNCSSIRTSVRAPCRSLQTLFFHASESLYSLIRPKHLAFSPDRTYSLSHALSRTRARITDKPVFTQRGNCWTIKEYALRIKYAINRQIALPKTSKDLLKKFENEALERIDKHWYLERKKKEKKNNKRGPDNSFGASNRYCPQSGGKSTRVKKRVSIIKVGRGRACPPGKCRLSRATRTLISPTGGFYRLQPPSDTRLVVKISEAPWAGEHAKAEQ